MTTFGQYTPGLKILLCSLFCFSTLFTAPLLATETNGAHPRNDSWLAEIQKKPADQEYFFTANSTSSASNEFVSTWNTTSPNETITLPLLNGGNYNFNVDWGDGSSDAITTWDQAEATHTYATANTYTVTITGTLEGFAFNNGGDREKIVTIDSWGNIKLSYSGYSDGGFFYGTTNLDITATDAPDLSTTTSLENAFRDSGIDTSGNLVHWNTTSITNMGALFSGATSFNQDLSGWRMQTVTNMTDMFNGVTLSTDNYDAILIAWDIQSLQPGINFNGGNSKYTAAGLAEIARTHIINSDSWMINDGGAEAGSNSLIQPPSQSDNAVAINAPYSFTPSPNTAAPLSFSLLTDAHWTRFDSNTGTISGIPSLFDIGEYSFTLSATLGTTTQQYAPFNVEVVPSTFVEPGTESIASNDYTLDNLIFSGGSTTAANSSSGGILINPIIASSSDTTPPTIYANPTLIRSASGYLTPLPLTSITIVDDTDTNLTAHLVEPQAGYRTGIFPLYWTATDSSGNTSFLEQSLVIYPMPSFIAKPTLLAEGSEADLEIQLSGISPLYPLLLSLHVSGEATEGVDHTLYSGNYTLNSGTTFSIPFNVLADGIEEDNETIEVDIDIYSADYRLGSLSAPMFTITEYNIPPKLTIDVSQNGIDGFMIEATTDEVTLDLTITDPNPSDTFTTQWDIPAEFSTVTQTDRQLVVEASSAVEGVYSITATVTDSSTPPATVVTEQHLQVVSSRPTLLSSIDSDRDGLDNLSDGLGDDDYDYLPNYLDKNQQSHILSMAFKWNNSYLIESETGLSLKLDREALLLRSYGAYISPHQYATLVSDHGYSNRLFDTSDTLVAFTVIDLERIGDTAYIAIPLLEPLGSSPLFSTYLSSSDNNGNWQMFIEDTENKLYGTEGIKGVCPEPTIYRYRPVLREDHHCLMLKVNDGGPNDRDGEPNGLISVMIAVEDTASGGVSVDTEEHESDQVYREPNERTGAEEMQGGAFSGYLLFMLLIFTHPSKSRGEST